VGSSYEDSQPVRKSEERGRYHKKVGQMSHAPILPRFSVTQRKETARGAGIPVKTVSLGMPALDEVVMFGKRSMIPRV